VLGSLAGIGEIAREAFGFDGRAGAARLANAAANRPHDRPFAGSHLSMTKMGTGFPKKMMLQQKA